MSSDARENPGLVFELIIEVPGSTGAEGLRAGARRLSLAAPFEELAAAGLVASSVQRVRLAPSASALSLAELRRFLHRACHLLVEGGELSFVARDPDAFSEGLWPGELCALDGSLERFRPLRHYIELLRLFPCRVRTPRSVEPAEGGADLLLWRATRLPDPLPETLPESPEEGLEPALQERYGERSPYRRFDRLEEPETADDLYYAAARLRPRPGERVLALGVNDGRELEMFAPAVRDEVELWGIDHSPSAIAAARERLPAHAARMLEADLAQLPSLGLPRFEVVLLLNVLQCTSVARDRLLADLKPLLAADARLLASIPNCHFGVGDILRRPLRREDARHDRSLVHKDLRYLTRELYRSGFRTVESFGTYDAFLLARR